MLRKGRSGFLANASACGSRAIVLLRPVIPRKSSAERIAGWPRSSLSGCNAGRKPGGGPTKDTVEQIAVEPSIGNTAGTTAYGRKSWPPLQPFARNLPQKIPCLTHRARVIQIGQNSVAEGKSLAADRAA